MFVVYPIRNLLVGRTSITYENFDGKTSHHGCQGNCKAVQIKNRVSGLGPTHKTFREDDRN
jgi:hypothetical protein